MRVKTIQARSMVELLERVRTEIGPQAVLLNVRRMELDETDHDSELLLEATAAIDPEAIDAADLPAPMPAPAPFAPAPQPRPIIRAHIPRAAYNEAVLDRIEIGTQPPAPARMREALAPVQRAPRPPIEESLPRPSQALFRKLGMEDSFRQDYPSDAVLVLVGPPGSGKSTAAAKIAAWLRNHTKRHVGLISADPGSAESNGVLQHHAKKLGLPCTSVRTASELRNRMSQWQRRGPILLDTPGLPSEYSDRLSIFSETLRTLDLPVETHLVMEADRSPATLVKCLRGYEPAGYTRVVLTGMDRANHPANAVSHVMATKAQVSFLSAGARAPNGLEAASPSELLKLFA